MMEKMTNNHLETDFSFGWLLLFPFCLSLRFLLSLSLSSLLQSRYTELVDDPAYLDAILKEGAEKASEVADQTVRDVKDAMGFLI